MSNLWKQRLQKRLKFIRLQKRHDLRMRMHKDTIKDNKRNLMLNYYLVQYDRKTKKWSSPRKTKDIDRALDDWGNYSQALFNWDGVWRIQRAALPKPRNLCNIRTRGAGKPSMLLCLCRKMVRSWLWFNWFLYIVIGYHSVYGSCGTLNQTQRSMIIIAGDAAEDEKNEKVLIKKGRDGFLLK